MKNYSILSKQKLQQTITVFNSLDEQTGKVVEQPKLVRC